MVNNNGIDLILFTNAKILLLNTAPINQTDCRHVDA